MPPVNNSITDQIIRDVKREKFLKKRIFFLFQCGWCPEYISGGFHPYLVFWLFKLRRVPAEGESIGKDDYKGIKLNFLWLPLMMTKSFDLFGKKWVINYPVRFRAYNE